MRVNPCGRMYRVKSGEETSRKREEKKTRDASGERKGGAHTTNGSRRERVRVASRRASYYPADLS